ncbi:hypothetical protein PLICRDRAFT_56738 [Plicaturopsis crispa FD-325 SS-3]|nr:hypothetical protein PLICRDRAFT_56738 [Plicaturopsis crispa FD-325 SS-3]
MSALTTAIRDDHLEMYEYYDNYKKATGDPAAQGRWARQLTWEIARHAVGEELVVYPLIEKHLGARLFSSPPLLVPPNPSTRAGAKGLEMTNKDRADHQVVKELLSQLESLSPGEATSNNSGTDAYEKTLARVMEHLRPHNESEENEDLPQLEPFLGKEGSEKAALSFKRTKKFVPTRAHPNAPNKGAAETLAGFLLLPIDALKDAFAQFPTEGDKEAAAK